MARVPERKVKMIYNLNTHIDRDRFKKRCNELYADGRRVELTIKENRTIKQNKYLHLIIGWVAVSVGVSLEFAKVEYFKRAANYGLFFGEVVDPLTGEVKIQERSTSTLTTAEMTEAIERFRNWSAMTEAGHPGIYLPEPNERDYLNEIEHEIERNKKEMV